jgi:dCTP deaminase
VLLRKGQLYLCHTAERLGSTRFVTSLIGRSSIGRLGLFVQLSANLGHRGTVHRWTLELLPAIDIYVYPGQTIGQVSFWANVGDVAEYKGWYGRHDAPMLSKLHVGATQHPEIRGLP